MDKNLINLFERDFFYGQESWKFLYLYRLISKLTYIYPNNKNLIEKKHLLEISCPKICEVVTFPEVNKLFIDFDLTDEIVEVCSDIELFIDFDLIDKVIEVCSDPDLFIDFRLIDKTVEVCSDDVYNLDFNLTDKTIEVCSDDTFTINFNLTDKTIKNCNMIPIYTINQGDIIITYNGDYNDLTYVWTDISNNILNTNFSTYQYTFDTSGVYKLTVQDGLGTVHEETFNLVLETYDEPIVTGIGPTVTLSNGDTFYDLTTAILTIDPSLTVVSINWTQLGTTPSVATITNVDELNPIFSDLDTNGSYYFQFIAEDSCGKRVIANLEIIQNGIVQNLPPTVNAGPDITVYSTSPVQINATANDPEGLPLTHSWVQLTGTTNATISDNTILQPTITNLAKGYSTFQITVTDSVGQTASDTMTFYVP